MASVVSSDFYLAPAVGDAAFREVVRRDLDRDGIAAQDADVVLPHLAADVGGDDMAVFQLDAEGGVGKGLDDGAFHFDVVFFRH